MTLGIEIIVLNSTNDRKDNFGKNSKAIKISNSSLVADDLDATDHIMSSIFYRKNSTQSHPVNWMTFRWKCCNRLGK